MRKLAIAILALLILVTLCSIQQTHAQGEKIATWFDYACYDYTLSEDSTLIEFYYALQRHQLTFAFVDTGYEASARIWIEILDSDSKLVDTLYKRIVTFVREPKEISNRQMKLADQIETLLTPGKYTARLLVGDVESQTDDIPLSGKQGNRTLSITVPNFDDRQLSMSGVELSYKINLLPLETDSRDYRSIDKSNRRIIPNPSRMFVDEDSVLCFYSEVYNLEPGVDDGKYFHVGCRLLDSYGKVVSDYGKRKHVKPGNRAIVSSAIDISDLPDGNYILRIDVTDGATGLNTTASKPFWLLSSRMEISPEQTVTEFTEEDAEYLEKVVKYALTYEQKKMLKKLDPAGKKRFFDDFWARSDPDPTTPINEFKVELFRRFNYSNEHFSVSIVKKDDGWQTDRGRVYIVYGEPDELENFPSTEDLKPFQKWNYNSVFRQGAKFFIFEDETGYGDYRLAHSDAEGETFDIEWDDRIKSGRLNEF